MDVFTHFSIIRRERRGIRPEEIKKLGLDKIISEKSSRIRNLVVAMIGARIINPQEKKRNQDNFPVHSFRTLLEDLEIMTIANPLL